MTRTTDSKTLRLLLFLVIFSVAFAGTTNFNALQLDPTQGETNSLLINNASGVAQVTVTAAGAATFAGAVTITGAQTFTGAAALNGGAVLADTKDLTCGADAGCDIGASGTEFGTAWVQTLDDGDGTVAVAAALTVAGNATVTGNVLPEADGTRAVGASGTEYGTVWTQVIDDGDGAIGLGASLVPDDSAAVTAGTTAAPFLAVHAREFYITAPTTVTAAAANITSMYTYVSAASNAVELFLPDATAADGYIGCVLLEDSTTNDVTVKSAAGTVGKSDLSAAGAAAGTGIVFADADNDTIACWVSDGTNWRVAPGTTATVD